MNIMEIISNRGMNGAVNHCLSLTRELRQRGHAMTLVCDGEAWIARQVAGEDIDLVSSDLHRWPTDELLRIASIVRKKRIDVVHTHQSRAHFFGVLLRWFTGVPSVATAQSRHIQLHWMFNDYVIAVSDATRRYHQSYNLVRSNRIETIHNHIDYSPIMEMPAETGAKMRVSLGIDDTALLVGAVGSIEPRKGQVYLVGAMPKVLDAVPEAHLLIVGGTICPEYEAKIASLADRLGVAGSVTWTGHRDDVLEIMTALDLCALASREESFPMTIVEAMAMGLPVVATPVGGVPECVVPGRTGTLVPYGDCDAMAETVVALLRDPVRRRRFGKLARRHAYKHFSSDAVIPCIEEVLRQTARRRRAA